MARTDKTKSLKAALPFAAGLLVALLRSPGAGAGALPASSCPASSCPAIPAQEQDGYHTMPKHFC